MDRSWEYINRSQTHMNVEIGTEAAQFPEKEWDFRCSARMQYPPCSSVKTVNFVTLQINFLVPLLPDSDAPCLNLKSLWINPGV